MVTLKKKKFKCLTRVTFGYSSLSLMLLFDRNLMANFFKEIFQIYLIWDSMGDFKRFSHSPVCHV